VRRIQVGRQSHWPARQRHSEGTPRQRAMGSAVSTLSGSAAADLRVLQEELKSELGKPDDESSEGDLKAEVARLRAWLRHVDAELGSIFAAGSGEGLTQATLNTASVAPGDTEEVLEDGTVVLRRTDGSWVQKDADGVIVEGFPDGRRIHTLPSGRSQETFPDGTKITRTEDGKMVVKRPDGSKLQRNPDKTTIEVSKEGTMVQYNPNTRIKIVVEPDGTQIQTNENDGSTIQVFPDGTKIDTDATGCRIVKYTDGRKVQRNPNGTVIESWPDGHKIQTKVDGSRIEVFPDGRKVQTLVDGTVFEQLKDGSRVRGMLGSYVCVQCWRCQTIMSVQRTAFVVSCRVCRNVLLANKAMVVGTKEGTTLQAASAKNSEEITKEVREIFERYDINSSSSIDRNELGAMLAELQFPTDAFSELFEEMDVNNNNQLEWDEFLIFYQRMQRHITDTAQGPVLAMTHDLLQEQQHALKAEQGKQEALLAVAQAQGNAAEVESTAKLVERLKEEYENKTAQLKQAMEAKRRRQKQFLEKRLQDRQKGRGTKLDDDDEDLAM